MMLWSTESMQPALVSFTGEREQRGITWGGTLTGGLDGGTMPVAPALAGAAAMTTTAQASPAAAERAARVNDLDTARAPVRRRLTIPFAPLVTRTWTCPRNLTFRSFDRMGPRYHFGRRG